MAFQLSKAQGLQAGSLRRSRSHVVVRASSSADNQLLKKPEPRKGTDPEPPKKLFSDAPATSSQAASSSVAAPPTVSSMGVVTIEYQRQRAKEMRAYFLEQKAQEAAAKATVFGWTRKNEISNGRWVMFGLMVGMLTEYATGVDFIHQIGLLGSYLGIVDFD